LTQIDDKYGFGHKLKIFTRAWADPKHTQKQRISISGDLLVVRTSNIC